MGCPNRVRKESGNGCEYFNSGGFCNYPHNEFYHCIDWMASGKYVLSKSQCDDWERCPYRWMLRHAWGVIVKPELRSIVLKQGDHFAQLISKGESTVQFSSADWLQKKLVEFFIGFIRQNKMMPTAELDWEIRLERENMLGYADCEIRGGHTFGEMKFTGSPDYYLNNNSAHNQLEWYFMLKPEYKDGWMLPIRNPKIVKARKKDEEPDTHFERIVKDVRKRPAYYFPEYKSDKTTPFKWGRCFSRLEFETEELLEKVRWIRREIMLACSEDYFIQRTANCVNPFPCDFIPICETGAINTEQFTRRGKKFRTLQELADEEKLPPEPSKYRNKKPMQNDLFDVGPILQ